MISFIQLWLDSASYAKIVIIFQTFNTQSLFGAKTHTYTLCTQLKYGAAQNGKHGRGNVYRNH